MRIKRDMDWYTVFGLIGLFIYLFVVVYFLIYKLIICVIISWLFSFDLVKDIALNQAATLLIFIYVKGYFLDKLYERDSNGKN